LKERGAADVVAPPDGGVVGAAHATAVRRARPVARGPMQTTKVVDALLNTVLACKGPVAASHSAALAVQAPRYRGVLWEFEVRVETENLGVDLLNGAVQGLEPPTLHFHIPKQCFDAVARCGRLQAHRLLYAVSMLAKPWALDGSYALAHEYSGGN